MTQQTRAVRVADYDYPAGTPAASTPAELDALPTGTQVLGIYPSNPALADVCEKTADGRWARAHFAGSPLESTDFRVFPVPVIYAPVIYRPEPASQSPARAKTETGRLVFVEGGQVEDAAWHRGEWMQTYTGSRFYPMDPRPDEIDPVDIAHALSNLCRYNGHVDRFYSVAEHCLLLSEWIEDQSGILGDPTTNRLALWALLHDATEAYVGDMIRPLKAHQPDYVAAENRVMAAIVVRFNLDPTRPLNAAPTTTLPPLVAQADTRILLDEKRALMTRTRHPWYVDQLEPLGVTINAYTPREAETMYLQRLDYLTAALAEAEGR